MAESLRDQLLKSGLGQKLKNEAQQKRASVETAVSARPARSQSPPRPALRRDSAEIDLAKAYALRNQAERSEQERTQREAELRAREKKERKQKLAALLNGKLLNDAQAEIPRHFPHGDKIRRVYCTAEQLLRLNEGDLGVVQHLGRYLLVQREVALAAQAIASEALVLLCEPGEISDDDIPSFI